MKRIGVLIPALLLSTVLVAPLATRTSAKAQSVSIRVYDRDHKDYHDWDDREQHAWERFRVEHPKYRVEFKRTTREQQREYWKWRHEHPDHD
jgi:hypothetical protein